MGPGSSTMINYFEKHGAHPCPPNANPAEWMLEVIGAAPGHVSTQDWHETWKSSNERREVKAELAKMKSELQHVPDDSTASDSTTFAAPFGEQFRQTFLRVWQQYWRDPTYIMSKLSLATVTALFVGFSFYKPDNSQQGLQNQLFTIFMLLYVSLPFPRYLNFLLLTLITVQSSVACASRFTLNLLLSAPSTKLANGQAKPTRGRLSFSVRFSSRFPGKFLPLCWSSSVRTPPSKPFKQTLIVPFSLVLPHRSLSQCHPHG